jgi:nucleotide-binding universal stress UspA family protein
MFKQILFPTKFGEFSLDILKSITCLKTAGLEQVVLLHVIETEPSYGGLRWGVDAELVEREASERLDRYAQYLRSQAIASKTRVNRGGLLSEVMRVAAEERVSLIAVGREKKPILGELFHSSSIPGIIRKSRIPVLIADYHTIKETEGQIREFYCSDIFRKILYPTDWSECAERAKKYLEPLRRPGTELLIVHVSENWFTETEYVKESVREELRNKSEAKLKALETELAESGFRVESLLLEGKIVHQGITELALEADVSLIIMGSHGKGFIAESLWGSVSHRVVEFSEKPVLIVK